MEMLRMNRRAGGGWRKVFRYFNEKHESTDCLTTDSLRRFLDLIWPHRRIIALLCVLTVINLALSVVLPISIGRFIDVVLTPSTTVLNNTTTLVVVLLVAIAACNFVEREVSVRAGWVVVLNIRKRLQAHLQRMSLGFLENYQVGRLVARLLSDTESLRHLLLGGLVAGSANLLRFCLIVGVLFWIDWHMTLVSCCTLPFFFVYFWRHVLRLRPAYDETNYDNSMLWAMTTECFSAARVVKTYGRESSAVNMFVARVHNLMRKALLIDRAQHLMGVIWEMSAGLGLVALIWYGGSRVQQGVMTAGELVTFYALLGQVHAPIAHLIHMFGNVQQSLASLEQMHKVLSMPSEISDKSSAIEAPTFIGDIRFDNVSFSYPELVEVGRSEEPGREALTEISFHAKAGQCTAIVGSSGSGKSTIVNLLARFYDADSGSITIDDMDIRAFCLATYRRQIAIVLQDTFLFHGTIRENIRYARPDASDDEIERAAWAANAMEFIERFPLKFDTYCGERGVKLSGGQKQRLSIARAVLANPRILILDEATSALDSASETEVQAAVYNLLPGRTTFIVAHRLSTVMRADNILVLDHGRVVESGTHEHLMLKEGRYFEMFMAQYGRLRTSRRSFTADPA
jgi:ABC-type multidrug transport system fused ATPase/permease subunit